MDLVIRGGTVFGAGEVRTADIAILDGKVTQVGGQIDAAEELDASGKYVLPGGVDMHVHLSPVVVEQGELRWVDDFASGSRSAAAGGITTVGNMSFPLPGERLPDVLTRTDVEASQSSIVDYLLHPVMWDMTEESLEDIGSLADAGASSLKLFMVGSNAASRPDIFVDAMYRAGQSGLLTMIHCEDGAVIQHLSERLVSEGRGDISHYGASRPVYSEATAVARAVAFARASNAPIYLVHVSSRDALLRAHEGRRDGLPVYVETRPDYLIFTEDHLAGPDGALYVGAPPLRSQLHVDAMWKGLASREVDTCCSDHAPWTKSEKLDPSHDISSFPGGTPALETMLSVLFSEGVLKGRISMERFVEVTSTNAAKLFGLHPQKGSLAVGSDADAVIWDPSLKRTWTADASFSNADYSLFESMSLTGGPTHTISRGEIIYAEGEIRAEEGRGRRVRPTPVRWSDQDISSSSDPPGLRRSENRS